MTDEELSKTLGIEACDRGVWCSAHDARPQDRGVCDRVIDWLDWAERGIELAKAGIGARIESRAAGLQVRTEGMNSAITVAQDGVYWVGGGYATDF